MSTKYVCSDGKYFIMMFTDMLPIASVAVLAVVFSGGVEHSNRLLLIIGLWLCFFAFYALRSRHWYVNSIECDDIHETFIVCSKTRLSKVVVTAIKYHTYEFSLFHTNSRAARGAINAGFIQYINSSGKSDYFRFKVNSDNLPEFLEISRCLNRQSSMSDTAKLRIENKLNSIIASKTPRRLY